MTLHRSLLFTPLLCALLAACSAGSRGAQAPVTATMAAPDQALPRAVVYRTTLPADSLVPVTLNADRTALASYPAPTDVRGQEPVRLPDGYLLDRRGITRNSAFTRWTYAEYAALPAAPTPAEIMANLDPGPRISVIYVLPFAAGAPDTAERAAAFILADSLDTLTPAYRLPRLRR